MIRFFMFLTLISVHIKIYADNIVVVKRPDKRFNFYQDCFYTNKKKEISPAEECLRVYNYFLVVPKGSLQICYVDIVNVERDVEGYKDRILNMSGHNKKVKSPAFPFKKSDAPDTECTTLQKKVHYESVIFHFLIKDFNTFLKSQTFKSFKEHFIDPCQTKLLITYDNKSKRERLFDVNKKIYVKVTDHFKRCN